MEQAFKRLNEKRIEKLAVQIVKYQKFSTRAIFEKIDTSFLSKETAKVYINAGISYIKAGTRYKAVPAVLFQFIDDAIANCVQPLRPAFGEARRETNRVYKRKEAVLPVNKVVKNIVEDKQEITSKFDYGIKIDNRIILFKSEDEMEQFIKNLRFINPETELKAVTVSYDKLW